VNDELVAEFTVVLLGDNETVEMEIFDLSGHLVRQLTQNRAVSAGRYRMVWDGMDDNDRLVPPGLYTVRLGVAADTDGAGLAKNHLLQTVAVTY
jgi:flagellar hook assembly protein FlgD